MSLSFVFNVEKLQNSQIGLAHRHNVRHVPTESQLPQSAWFTEEGRHESVGWNAAQLAVAHGLAKRKDAVEALSFIIQFGNQTDWRESPTEKEPHGRPREWPVDLKQANQAIQRWVELEFGKENLVSLELHTDESTPHFHLIVTPIKNGKLQAKNWLNGAASVASLRKRAYQEISKTIACAYQPGRAGGQPHDPKLAAGYVPTREDLQAEKNRAKQAERAASKARVSRTENETLRTELLTIKIVAQREKDEAEQRYAELKAHGTHLLGESMVREHAAIKQVAALESQVRDLTERLDAAVAITSLLSEAEREQILDRPAAALRRQTIEMIERMENDRADGRLTDLLVAKHMLSKNTFEQAYREYFPFGNEITQMMDAQKRAQSAQSASQHTNPRQTLENAPKRDSEASSYGF
jgi:hypothetical protein